jgi:dihydropteroate synthase
MHLRPIQFVDSPVGRDGEVARLAGGMLWFAGYEVIEDGQRRTVAIADFDKALGSNDRAVAFHHAITAPRPALTLGDRTLRFDQPQAGAALIDVGGESTRPNAPLVWEGDEAKRVVPVIERLAASGTLVSIDTRKAMVMEAALGAGARIVNDVSALLWDDRALAVVARAGCPVILMHSPDPKKGPHGGAGYTNVLTEVFDWLEARIAAAVAGGVDRSRIIVDPGIGFGKSLTDNLALINGLTIFHGLGCPIMLGASRKRMIGALSNEAPTGARLGGSLALAMKGVEAGVQLLRVHDMAETVQAIHVWRGLRDQALVGR